ncbi:MAG: hypothetical protein ACTSXG_02980 [Alphaproteobacteria bacterium]
MTIKIMQSKKTLSLFELQHPMDAAVHKMFEVRNNPYLKLIKEW